MPSTHLPVGVNDASSRPGLGHRAYIWVKRALVLISILFGAYQLALVADGTRQNDLKIYYLAAQAHERGLDPYDIESLRAVSGMNRLRLPFIYPPYSLLVFKPLAALPYQHAYYVYLLLKLVAVCILFFVWTKVLPVPRSDWWALFVAAVLGYRYTVCRDLLTGNVSTYEQIALWVGILLLLKDRRVSGGVCIALSALCKMTTLALLPLIAVVRRGWSSLRIAAGVLAGALAFFGFSYCANPAEWTRLLRVAASIDERIFRNPSSLALSRDLADFFGLGLPAALVMYAAVCIVVLGAVLRALSASRKSIDAYPVIYLIILAYCLVVPRLKDYSLIIAVLPTLHILASLTRARWEIVAGCILFWIPMISYQPIILVGLSFLIVNRWIFEHRHEPGKKVPLSLDPLRPVFLRTGIRKF